MADIGWRRRRGSSPAARTGARQRAGLTPASASNTLSCQRETLHSRQLKSITKSIDSHHGIYRDLRNVDANYPFERSHRSVGVQPNSRLRDHSRLSCRAGGTQLRLSANIPRRPRADGGRRSASLRGRANCHDFCQSKGALRAAKPATPLLSLHWTFRAKRGCGDHGQRREAGCSAQCLRF